LAPNIAEDVQVKRYKTVDEFIEGMPQWHDELQKLRKILLGTKLEENVKWGAPCYTHGGKNVVGIGAFKSYVGLWFYDGALLADSSEVLINAQEGKTKSLRQWRFDSAREINGRLIKEYVKEAISLVDQGIESKPVRGQAVSIPPQLKSALTKNRSANTAFMALTLGKQREYAAYIADAKREETKITRLAKILPMIEAGKGLNDHYRNC